MSDSMTPEKPLNIEIQGQTAFDRMQPFLQEKGESVTRTISGTDVQTKEISLKKGSFFVEVYPPTSFKQHPMDLHAELKVPVKGDWPHHMISKENLNG